MKIYDFLHEYEPVREWFIAEINKPLAKGKRAERQKEFSVRTVNAMKYILDNRKVHLSANELMLFLYGDMMNSFRNHFFKPKTEKSSQKRASSTKKEGS